MASTEQSVINRIFDIRLNHITVGLQFQGFVFLPANLLMAEINNDLVDKTKPLPRREPA